MRFIHCALLGASLLWTSATSAAPLSGGESMKVPVFGAVTIYGGTSTPRSVVLFVSGDGGWNLGVTEMARRLHDDGALVVGIDIRRFMKTLDSSDRCAYPAGPLEQLSQAVQRRYGIPAYIRPVLAGYSSGATLVYAAIAAAPPETFAGAISLGFCPDLEIRRAPCQVRGLVATRRLESIGYHLAPFPSSTVPWMVVQGDIDRVCDPASTRAFVSRTGASRLFLLSKVGHGFSVPSRWVPQLMEAYHAVTALARISTSASATSPAIADLELVEVVPPGSPRENMMAVILSGDGGWAGRDKAVASRLAAANVPVVGWSSLT